MTDTANLTPSQTFADVPANFRKGARLTRHQRRRHRAVLRMLRGLDGRVLDYGCGYGDLTYAISHTHPVVGCDIDPVRVAFAKQEYPAIEFRECAAEGAPFDEGAFDIVVSSVVIHFVPDPRAYLAEIGRLLRDGGHLLIVCQNEPVVRNLLRRVVGKGKAPTVPATLWVPPLSAVRAMLASQGFEIVGSTYFFDPPFSGWNRVREWAIGMIGQGLSILRCRAAAHYWAYLAQLRKAKKGTS